MPPNKDYYKILQLDPSAEPEVIDAAYRRLMLKYHPDTNRSPGASEKAKDINEAYEHLKDPQKRREYDATRSSKSSNQARPASGNYNYDSSEEIRRREKAEREAYAARQQAEYEREKRKQAEAKEREAQEKAQAYDNIWKIIKKVEIYLQTKRLEIILLVGVLLGVFILGRLLANRYSDLLTNQQSLEETYQKPIILYYPQEKITEVETEILKPTPTNSPPHYGTVSVNPQFQWVEGMTIKKGSEITISANGSIKLSFTSQEYYSPYGSDHPCDYRCTYPQGRFGQLIGRIGLNGDIFPVNKNTSFTVSTDDILFLGVNDCCNFSDNSGEFTVEYLIDYP